MNLLGSYCNPVWSGYCADPFCLLHDGIYYVYGTHADPAPIGSEKRHFVLLASRDLVHWEDLGGALTPAPGLERADHWAPEVAYAQGKFWMYYSASATYGGDATQRLRVAVAARPEGPFEDIDIELFPEEGFTIDASPFRDPRDGTWYLFFAKDFFDERVGTGIAVAPLSDDMVTPLAAPQVAIRASADWHISSRSRTHYGRFWETWHTVEGPQVVFHDNLYYCLYSGGAFANETYGVSFAVAGHPLGPWRDEGSGPSVLSGIPGHIIGPGHNSVTTAPDGKTLICVYHAWDAAHTARRLCVDPIEWTASGPRVIPTYCS